MLHDIILAFTKFPGAESIHLLQGVVAGCLLAVGYLKRELAYVGIALTLLAGFAIYEGYERWRIGDNADTDFQVFLITMWAACILTLAVTVLKTHWRKNDG